jgi:Fic family protein
MQKVDNYNWNSIRNRVDEKKKYERRSNRWDELFDGNTYRLVQGEDFDNSVRNFMQNARNNAKELGVYIRIRKEDENTVILQSSLDPLKTKKRKRLTKTIYRRSINFVNRRSKIRKSDLARFFGISEWQAKKLIDQLVKDGYLQEFDRTSNSYRTTADLPGLTVTTVKPKQKISS